MKKAVIIASTASMILQFNMNNIKLLQEDGYDVMVACNFRTGNSVDNKTVDNLKKQLKNINVIFFEVPIPRNPFKIKNLLISYKILKALSQKYYFEIMHCHSPIGAAISRLAFKNSRKKGTKIIYTAHGFHFYKGCPTKNWLLYYPIEYILSAYTDVLITINHEDYQRAKHFKAVKVEYIPGIGINLNNPDNSQIDRKLKRQELKIPLDAFLMLSVGELNKNKNHKVVIQAMSKIKNDKLHYIVCGQGKDLCKLKDLTEKLKISARVHLLEFRTDVNEIYPCADIYLFPSYREGLSVSLMEAMSYGLPCIASNIRGNTDLIDNNYGGFIVSPNKVDEFKFAIEKAMIQDISLFGEYNKIKIQAYSAEKVSKIMKNIYCLKY